MKRFYLVITLIILTGMYIFSQRDEEPQAVKPSVDSQDGMTVYDGPLDTEEKFAMHLIELMRTGRETEALAYIHPILRPHWEQIGAGIAAAPPAYVASPDRVSLVRSESSSAPLTSGGTPEEITVRGFEYQMTTARVYAEVTMVRDDGELLAVAVKYQPANGPAKTSKERAVRFRLGGAKSTMTSAATSIGITGPHLWMVDGQEVMIESTYWLKMDDGLQFTINFPWEFSGGRDQMTRAKGLEIGFPLMRHAFEENLHNKIKPGSVERIGVALIDAEGKGFRMFLPLVEIRARIADPCIAAMDEQLEQCNTRGADKAFCERMYEQEVGRCKEQG